MIQVLKAVVMLSFLCLPGVGESYDPLQGQGPQETPIHIGDTLYLNGCEGNPQSYARMPKVLVDMIYEVPNQVVSLEPSPFGRPFQTKSHSQIDIDGRRLMASLENFRIFKIYDENGKVCFERKITGATSLYEVRDKGKVIAWGVGWHRYCWKSYEHVDFTTFRVFFPRVSQGKTLIDVRLFNGLQQSAYKNHLKSSKRFVIVASDHLGDFPTSCYYCLPIFTVLDPQKGYVEIDSFKSLQSESIAWELIKPVYFASWLAYYADLKTFKKYLSEHYVGVVQSMYVYDYFGSEGEEKRSEMIKNEKSCRQFITKGHSSSIESIAKKCFPHSSGEDLVDDYWRYMFENNNEK